MKNKEAISELIKYRRRLEKDSTIDAEPFDMAIEALKAQATLDDVSTAYENGYMQGKFEAQQWIPCSERLPEKDGKYLITEVDGYVTCDYFRLENGDWRITFPIAWMLLPEAYTEEYDGLLPLCVSMPIHIRH